MAGIASDISVADKVNVTGTPSIYLRAAYPDASKAVWYKFSGSVAELEKVLDALRQR